MRIYYRLRQFLRGLTATIDANELALVAEVLTQDAYILFQRMPIDAQRHSLNVLNTLRAAGHDDPDLGVAALLHDVGKVAADEAGVPLRLWLRGPLVLGEAIASDRLQTLTSDAPADGWRYALHVHYAHPQIGAAWARQAGCSALACWLIEHHQDAQVTPIDDENARLLTLLQWADDRN